MSIYSLRLSFLSAVDDARRFNELLNKDYGKADPFARLREGLTDYGVSLYQLVSAVAVIVVICVMMISAIGFAKKNPEEREAAKKKFELTIFVGIAIFAMLAIIAFIEKMATKVVGVM